MATKKKADQKPPVKKTKADKQAALSKASVSKPQPAEADDGEQLPGSIPELQEMCDNLWEEIIEQDDIGKKSELVMRYNIAAGAANTLAGDARIALITKDNIPKRLEVPEEPKPASTPAPKEKGKAVAAAAANKANEALAPPKKGDIVKFVFAGGKVDGVLEADPDGDRAWVKDGKGLRYHIYLDDILLDGETPAQNIVRRKQSQKSIAEVAGASAPKPATVRTSAPKAAAEPKRTELKVMKKTAAIEKILAQQISGADIIRQVYDLVTGWNETTKKAAHPEKWDTEDFVLMSGINRSRVKGCIDKFRS